MPKYRKMLTDYKVPYIQSIFRLIETQSKETIAKWCVDYAEKRLLPIYEDAVLEDFRPRVAINVAREWFAGNVKLPEVKSAVSECTAAARDADENPTAQAAARAMGSCVGAVYASTYSAGLMFYGALAVAYNELGINAEWEKLLEAAEDECWRIKAELEIVAVENEPNPVKVKWNC